METIRAGNGLKGGASVVYVLVYLIFFPVFVLLDLVKKNK